jgi:signal transduction histidine kinase
MSSAARSVPVDFRLLFESAPVLYLVLNPQLKIVAASNDFLRATMTTRESILGREIFEVFPANPQDPSASEVLRNLNQSLSKVLRDRVPDVMPIVKYDLRRLKADGGGFEERYWSPINSPVLGKDRQILYIISRIEDVTEFVRPQKSAYEQGKVTQELGTRAEKMEAEVYLRARRLEELNRNRLEALGRLAAAIAHDFNNLLGVVLGNAELLQEHAPEGSPLCKGLANVAAAANRAADLTKQLLAYSQQEVLEPKTLNFNEVLVGMEPMIRLIPKNVEVLTLPARSLDPVKAIPGQIEQIMMNLAINARDAMPDGGKLIIETSNVFIDETYRKQHPDVAVKTGHYVMLSVADTGVGIDPEIQQHIFEPFFTTKAKGKGTGIGLATVYGIVKQLGGYVWFYSEHGKGTAFKVYLPRAVRVDSGATGNNQQTISS